jgi:hypothetical protein
LTGGSSDLSLINNQDCVLILHYLGCNQENKGMLESVLDAEFKVCNVLGQVLTDLQAVHMGNDL